MTESFLQIRAGASLNASAGSEPLSVFVGLPEKLDTEETLAADSASFSAAFSESAWRNDTVCTKLILLNRCDETLTASITAGRLISDTGSVIDNRNIHIRRMQNVCVNIGRNDPSAPVKPFPDVLVPEDGAIEISPHSVRFVWIDISIPMDTHPGIYRGTLSVTAQRSSTAERTAADGASLSPVIIDCTLHVIDLVQPSASDTSTLAELWQYPFAIGEYYGVKETKYFTDTHFKYLKDSLLAYQETGGRAVTATIVEEAWNHQSFYGNPSMIKWFREADGTFSFDYSWYDRWISYAVRLGILDPGSGIGMIQCYSIVPWENQIGYTDRSSGQYVTARFTPGTDEWTAVWTAFLTDFISHSEAKRWLDLTYIAMDERKPDELVPAVELIRSVRSTSSGKHFKIFSALNYNNQDDPAFTDKIDDVSVALCHIEREGDLFRRFAAHRRELGLNTTIYNCTGIYPGSFLYNDPAENEWMMWYTLAQGADGFLRWAWDNWTDDPLGGNSYSVFEPGDCWYVYPAAEHAASGSHSAPYCLSSPRCEMLKKGIRDISKAKFLMQSDPEIRKKLLQLLDTLRRPAECINEYGSAAPASDEDAHMLLEDTVRMRNRLMELSEEFVNHQKRTAG